MSDEKKIIIDEDWKSQVEAEKQAVQAGVDTSASGDNPATSAGPGDVPMPPASFDVLITMLATEALMAMGQMPHPATGTVQVQRNQAQYLIDTIDMLREKTKGNLSAEESQLLEDVVHQLRLTFVATAK